MEILKVLKATHYINPHSGYKFFDENKYNTNGIDIKFLKSNLTPYKQSWREDFQTGLSIIDLMMFKSKDKIKELLLNDYVLLTKQDLIKENI